MLPSSVCSFSSSDEINTCLTLREARQVTAFYFVWYFSTNFKMAVSRISSLLLSVHAFMFPAISKESLIVSCFNLSLWLDHKVVNVLNTLSTALLDNERPKINLAKTLGNSFWWFSSSCDQTSINLKLAYLSHQSLMSFHFTKDFGLVKSYCIKWLPKFPLQNSYFFSVIFCLIILPILQINPLQCLENIIFNKRGESILDKWDNKCYCTLSKI